MLSSNVQTDVELYLLCKRVTFGQPMADVMAAECRQMEFDFLCIYSDIDTTIAYIPQTWTTRQRYQKSYQHIQIWDFLTLSYHVSWSFLSSLTKYLIILCLITLKNTCSFSKHCLLLQGGLLLSQKLSSFPFCSCLRWEL